MCVGFPAAGESHHLENRGKRPASYLEIGDRTEGDEASYPFDDLVAHLGSKGWRFAHKNGEPYLRTPASWQDPGRLKFSAPCKIGRAHVLTPVTNAHLVCRLMLETIMTFQYEQ